MGSRVLAAVAKATGLGVVLALATAGSAILHLGLAAPRRFVTARVNALLAQTFAGRIEILRVGALHLTRIAGVDAEVFDPDGARVLDLHGLRARLGVAALLRSLVSGGPLVVRIAELGVDSAEIALAEDAAGHLGLVRAFDSRGPSTGGRGAEISAPEIHLRHAWVHGHLAPAPIIDADLEDLAAAYASAPTMTELAVEHLFVRGRGLPGMNPVGEVQGRATLPGDPNGERRVRARYDGRIGDVPVRADGSLEGKTVVAILDVPETAPAAFMALAPGKLHLGAPLSAHAEVHGEIPLLAPELRARLGEAEIVASGTVTLPGDGRPDLVASAKLGVKDLDLSVLQVGAPRSRLTANLEASVVSRPQGRVSGTFQLESQVGAVAGQVVPELRARGDFTERSVRGAAQIAERGAPTSAQFSLQPRDGGASPDQLALRVETTIPDLNGVARLGPIGRGSAHLVAEGRMDLTTKQVSADASVELAGIDARGVQLARGVVTGSAEGAPASPRVVARLLGTGLRAGGYAFTSVRAGLNGAPRDLDVTAELVGDDHTPTVTARAGLADHGEITVRADVVAALRGVGELAVTAPEITLAGPATSPSAWRDATGTLAIHGAVDLARLMARLPASARPVASASGRVTLRGKASRASRGASPTVDLEGATEGLTLVVRREPRRSADGRVMLGPPPLHTEGLDAAFGVKLDGSSGRARLDARLHDHLGTFASLDAAATLPLADLLRSPRRAAALLREAPLEADLVVPRRSLDAMPSALGTPPVKGDVELAVALRGTARAPELTLTGKGTSLLPRGAAACVTGADVEARLSYDGEAADAQVTASRDGREIMATRALLKVDAAQALGGGPIAWEASGDVTLDRFPLDAVGALVGRPLAGEITGAVALHDLHRAARLRAELDLRALALDDATLANGEVRVAIADGAVSATARVDQTDGYAQAGMEGAMAWGAALAPHLDVARPVEVTLQAKSFRAGAASPFVQGVFSELDGRLDADARLHIDPTGKESKMSGAIALRDGVLAVPQLGERFHAVRGDLTMNPWGTLRLEGFSAEAPTGRLTASAEAVVDGLALRRATARVHIPRGQSLPLSFEGVPLGRAWGEVTTAARMSPDGQRLDLRIDIPTLHVELPRSTGHAVQPLALDDAIRVGVHAGHDFVSIPLEEPEAPRAPSDRVVHAAIKLGPDVEVRRDTTAQVVVDGQVNVEVSDRVHLTGQINLERGRLELQGKLFTIDHGTVSFAGGDPANPMIIATAYWDAPDATRVYADFSGHVTSGKLELRSEPSLSQDEILALVLFGAPDGSLGSQPAPGQAESTGVAAAGLAGSFVTDGLNKAISGITGADITTRVDTSKAGSPRPELAVQISRNISAQLGFKLGVPGPGENPDRTELTLDWRFLRGWSLVAVVGDQGSTALDLLWRLRY